ncbi:hypothetical protein ERJ75_001142400 [Trypanosoma vivax]|nr:hypothetical protein ERJ75_001142400 [Trypanosoma vivax]
MLATGVRLLAAVCVTLLACTSIEATTPEGLPSGAAKIICDFGRELMDAAKIAAEAAKAARKRRGWRERTRRSSRQGKQQSTPLKPQQERRRGRRKSSRGKERGGAPRRGRRTRHQRTGRAAEGAAKASSEATVSAHALKQYITVLGALAGKTTSAKTCLDATGDMTVSNGLDTYLKTKCAQMFPADSNLQYAGMVRHQRGHRVAKANGRVGSVTEHSNLGEESNGNTQDKCILFARAASSNAGIAVARHGHTLSDSS